MTSGSKGSLLDCRQWHAALMPDYGRAAAVYWWLLVALGAAALWRAGWQAHALSSNALTMGAWGCLLAMVAGAFPLRIPESQHSFTFSDSVVFLMLLMLGPWAATLAAAGDGFMGAARSSGRWTSRLSTPAGGAVAMTVAGAAWQVAHDALRQPGLPEGAMLIPLTIAAEGLYLLLSTAMLRALLQIKHRQPLQVLLFLPFPYAWVGMLSAFLAALLYLTWRHEGPWFLVTTAVVGAALLAAEHWHLRLAARQAALASHRLGELKRRAGHDGLTSLPNRSTFRDSVSRVVDPARTQPRRRIALMYLDFDRFKQINDTLGHAAGDELLVAVSRRMQQQLRAGDVVGRLGGDEFAVLADPVDSEDQAVALALRLLTVLAEPYAVAGSQVSSSASIGIAFAADDDPRDCDQLLRDADRAMFQAKAAGRGRYAVFRPTGESARKAA